MTRTNLTVWLVVFVFSLLAIVTGLIWIGGKPANNVRNIGDSSPRTGAEQAPAPSGPTEPTEVASDSVMSQEGDGRQATVQEDNSVSPSDDVIQMDLLTPEMLQELFFAKSIESNFQSMIQKVAADVPEIPVAIGDEPVKWRTLHFAEVTPRFETHKRSIGIFKFRSSLKEPADLHWAFAVPEGRSGEWYITPANGTMKGFQRFESDRTIDVKDNSYAPGSLYVFQELVGGHILPGEEYIIWYLPPEGAERRFRVTLKLTETGHSDEGKSAAEIRAVMGVQAQPHKFSQTPDGLRSALETAHRILLYEPSSVDSISAILRDVWNQLPYLDVNDNSGPNAWNRVVPNLSFRFQAFRIKTSAEAADLDWCHVVGSELMRWGFVSRDPQVMAIDDYGIELNLPIPGVANSERNVAIFQHVSQGQFRANNEYAVWFMPVDGVLSEFDATLRLTPNAMPTDVKEVEAKEKLRRENIAKFQDRPVSDEPVDVRKIGKNLAIDVPEIPSSARISEAMELCQQLLRNSQMRTMRFQKLMQFAVSGLPELKVDGESSQWTKIDLNQNGQRLVGYRIGDKWKMRGQVISVVARPSSIFSQMQETYFNKSRPLNSIPANERERGLIWGNIDYRQIGIHMVQRRSAGPLTMLGPSIPASSVIDYDLYSDWDFDKFGPYVIVFSPVTDEPMTVYLSVKVEKLSLKTERTAWVSNNGQAPNDPVGVLEWMGLREGDPINSGTLIGKPQEDARAIRFVDANTLVVGTINETVTAWNVHDPSEPKQISDVHDNPRINAMSPDERYGVWLGYFDGKAVVEEIQNPNNSVRLTLPDGEIPNSCCFSPDGDLVIGNYGKLTTQGKAPPKSWVCLWHPRNGKQLKMQEFPPESPVRDICWLRDGRIVAVGSQLPSLMVIGRRAFNVNDSGIKIPMGIGHFMILDPNTLKPENDIAEEGLDWRRMRLSSDGTRLAIFAANGCLRFLDPQTLETQKTLASNLGDGLLALSNDGRRLAIRGVLGDVQIWDVDLGRVLSCGEGRLPLSSQIALSPDGDRLVIADKDRNVRLYKIYPADRPNGETLVELEMIDSLGIQMSQIPVGRFNMGRSQTGPPHQAVKESPQHEAQKPRHIVQITKPFFMGRHEVTVAQFRKFVDATDYRTTAETSGKGGQHIVSKNGDFQNDPQLNWKTPGFPQEDNHPVVQVSYVDANAFCDWLSKRESAKYRLPTEAEWEYACRAGTGGNSYYGGITMAFRCANIPDKELIKAYGSFAGAFDHSDGFAYTAPVGSYIPNGYGLYDMLGNVWEWCSDWYSDKYYESSPMSDPKGPVEGNDRVQRGGGFLVGPAEADWRDLGPPDQGQSSLGFRIVREIP